MKELIVFFKIKKGSRFTVQRFTVFFNEFCNDWSMFDSNGVTSQKVRVDVTFCYPNPFRQHGCLAPNRGYMDRGNRVAVTTEGNKSPKFFSFPCSGVGMHKERFTVHGSTVTDFPISDLRPPTSDLCPLSSVLWLLSSVLWLLSSVLWLLSPNRVHSMHHRGA